MVILQEISYQNFLGAGNAPITVRLDKHPSTLVVGKNGVGKSTFPEAVCFALFGRPFRDVTKPDLVNWVNQRECLTELTFTTQDGSYIVRRGIKPNIFEIYKNGTLVPMPAEAKDYQTLLETSYLKLNYKTFVQVVVLGAASYVPFMRLGPTARKDIIEDLLDIEVFSSMNALAKEDVLETKAALDKCDTKTQLLTEQVKMSQAFTTQIETQNKELVDTIEANMVLQSKEIGALLDERKTLVEDVRAYDQTKLDLDAQRTKQRELEKTLYALQRKANELSTKHAFYTDHDNCPECEQIITEEFKTTKFASFTEKESAASQAIAKCEAFIERHRTQAEALVETLSQANRLTQRIQKIDAQLPLYRRRLIELEQQLKSALAPKPQAPAVDVVALSSELDSLKDEHDAHSRKRVVLAAATMLLKDNGIKTRVIRHYLPIINKQVNHYLAALDFPVNFKFDESFKEHITMHHNEFSYNSFSNGEKQRMDLALLLTWRAVARLKNSAALSLLVMDEVFDSSLDVTGIDDAMKVIAGLESDVNVFVISHRDQNVDKFSNVLTFEKYRGFSMLR